MPTKLSTGSPVLPPDSLFYLLSDIPKDQLERARSALATKHREALLKAYGTELAHGRRKNVWVLGEELSRRGVPPAFRRSPWAATGEPFIPEEDMLLLDVQWLAARYPSHRSAWKRYPRPFAPTVFEHAAKSMLWRGLRQPHFYLKVLALNEDQQVECVYLRGAPIRRRMEVIDTLSTEAFERLKLANRSNSRARAQEAADWRQTVQRRHDIWHCGSMADWMPKRTAELYEALTGTEITRALAGKIIDEVHRDFPLSKPAAKRRRRRKAAMPKGRAVAGRGSKVRKGKPPKAKTHS